MKLKKLLPALAICLCFLTTHVNASLLYIDAGPSSNQQEWSTGDYTAGTEFTISNPDGIRIDQLGWLDAEGDGLSVSHQVSIWRVSDQAVMASAFVTPGGTTQLSAEGTGVWYLSDIGSTVDLAAGVYRIGGYMGAADNVALSNDQIGNGVSVTPGYVRTDFPGGFNYPNLSFSSNGIRVTMGLSQAVPEPSTITLLGGLAAVGLIRRRKR